MTATALSHVLSLAVSGRASCRGLGHWSRVGGVPAVARATALAAVLALPFAAARAQAPGPVAASGAEQEPVVVTGSLQARRLLDAPFAASVVDAATLRAAGPLVNLSEALVQVPGLVAANRQNYAQDLQISSRGFGARAPFGVRGLRLYTDGIPATMPDGQGQVAHVDLAGAQRVEVLRGPFSVLFGSNSGGVIAVFTAPVRRAESELAVDIGRYGLRQGRVGLAAPVATVAGGALDLRASYTDLQLDGFRPQSAADRQLGNLRLGWDDGRDSLVLLVSHHAQQAQDPLGLTWAQFQANPRQTVGLALGGFDPLKPADLRYDTRKTIEQTQAGLRWRHRFAEGGPWREAALTVYDGARSVTQWQSIPPSAQAASRRHGGGVVDFDRRYGGLEGRVALDLGPAALVVGASVETQEDDRHGFENYSGPATAPTALGITGRERRDETNRATTREAYAQAEWPLASAWTLTGGVRGGRLSLRTRDRYIVCNDGTRVASAADCGAGNLSAARGNLDDSGALAFSYTQPVLGLRWQWAPQLVLHASAARGQETPTLGELAYRPLADGAGGFNPDVKPQRSRQLELGLKWRAAGWMLDAALFDVATRDEIGVRENLNGRSVFQNVGRTQRRGAELAAGGALAPGLKLNTALAWLQAEYLDSQGSIVAGNRLPATQRATAWAQLAWTPGGVPGELALEWRAVARSYANDANTAAAPGHALAHLRWRGQFALGPQDTLDLLARVDNLLDRAHVGSVIVNDANSRFFEPGAPRSVLLSARWLHRF